MQRLRLHSWALSTSDLKQALAAEGALHIGEDPTRRELVDAAAAAFPEGICPPRAPPKRQLEDDVELKRMIDMHVEDESGEDGDYLPGGSEGGDWVHTDISEGAAQCPGFSSARLEAVLRVRDSPPVPLPPPLLLLIIAWLCVCSTAAAPAADRSARARRIARVPSHRRQRQA